MAPFYPMVNRMVAFLPVLYLFAWSSLAMGLAMGYVFFLAEVPLLPDELSPPQHLPFWNTAPAIPTSTASHTCHAYHLSAWSCQELPAMPRNLLPIETAWDSTASGMGLALRT